MISQLCVTKIYRVPKSEEERSLVPFESATGYKNAAYLSTSGFVEYSIKSCDEAPKSSDGTAIARARPARFD